MAFKIAKFTINQYTITFDLNYACAPADPDDITDDYDTTVNLPANPTRTGYVFLGWSEEADDIVDVDNEQTTYTIPDQDITLTAVWEIIEYTVTFEYDVFSGDATFDTQYVEYGSNATLPTPPTLPGYSFVGWTGSVENITADTTIVARYVAINYLITVSVLDGEGSVQVSGRPNVDRTITITATPEEGFAFINWVVYYYDENSNYQAVTVLNATSSTTTLTMPAYDVVIEAYFGEVQFYQLAWADWGTQQNDELEHDGTYSSMLNALEQDIWVSGGYGYLSTGFDDLPEFLSNGGSITLYDVNNTQVGTVITNSNVGTLLGDTSTIFTGRITLNLTYPL